MYSSEDIPSIIMSRIYPYGTGSYVSINMWLSSEEDIRQHCSRSFNALGLHSVINIRE